MVPNLKSVAALTNAFTLPHSQKEKVAHWAGSVSAQVRMVAKQWRDLAMYPDRLETCLRKAWGMQNKNREGHLRTMSLWGQALKASRENRL